MSTAALAREIELLLRCDLFRPRTGASEREIREAEAELDVRFPPLYRWLVRRYGTIMIYHRSVFGLGPWGRRKRGLSSVIFHTTYARRSIDLPNRYIVLWHESHADVWCLDTKSSSAQCPVWHLDPEVQRHGKMKPVKVAPSFVVWLRQIVDKQLKVRELLDRESPGVYTPTGAFRTRKAKTKFLAKMREREAAKQSRAARKARAAAR